MLAALGRADNPRLIVLEGREALRAEPAEAIEAALHAVNEFVRADAGANTLVVWPTNTDDLTTMLASVAGRIGAEASGVSGIPISCPALGTRAYVRPFRSASRATTVIVAVCRTRKPSSS